MATAALLPIALNLPSKYCCPSTTVATTTTTSIPQQQQQHQSSPPPSLDWLTGTWTVTHSTLSMWRSTRNVRITYTSLSPRADGRARVDDLVEYEPAAKTGVRKTVVGVDTQAVVAGAKTEPETEAGAGAGAGASWDWRGKGWLFFVASHWEVLGWGQETTPDGVAERWAVTWFAPTLFTKEGLDVYCDRREGLSDGTYRRIEDALKGLDAPPVVAMVNRDMRPVEIKLPWTEA